MKKILITGKNSYVGTSLKKWLDKYPDRFLIDSISIRNDSWKKRNFSEYDVVFHAAGIAHIKETNSNAYLYYKVNRDLAYEVAQKAKKEGVKHFIFLSSMSVYGRENGVITKDSSLTPKSNYGKSKLEAEKLITPLGDDNFKIVIVRPPMIYGKGCKGNYNRLSKLANNIPLFPDIKNKRSMIYIDNMCEFVRKLIEGNCSGTYYPQNEEYVCTSELVNLIAKSQGKKVLLTKLFNPILKILKTGTFNKVFGDLVYEKSMSGHLELKYTVVNFKDSVEATEG
ncbi:NAD-dependent epimerase/dehydratase family protein [Oceanobacillus senegalensis]|uniref:NAD-dependent epimerase/dehydratase family protein n=1 Tax=Oceanobacillus senegalensis TaxID=1936063 RepID=UPI000A30A3B3|nr:NAD-dependent epimerase/dehydratase family protein [Oceanobacillus senegalensis]